MVLRQYEEATEVSLWAMGLGIPWHIIRKQGMAESGKPPLVSSLRRWNGYASNPGRRRNTAHFSPFNGSFTSYTRRSGVMLSLMRGWRYFFRATTEKRKAGGRSPAGQSFSLFVPIEAYRQAGELAEDLHAGEAVIVAGKLKWSSWTAKDGQKRISLCVLARFVKRLQRVAVKERLCIPITVSLQ